MAIEAENARVTAEFEAAQAALEAENTRLTAAAEEAVRQLSEDAARYSTPPPPPPGFQPPPTPIYADSTALDDLAAFANLEQNASVASMFSEISASPLDDPPAAAPEEPEVEEEEREPAYAGGMSEFADTASLLRELSSLGIEDEPAGGSSGPSAPRAPAPRPGGSSQSAANAAKGKRKGLFGR
ncbi:MAG: hypothetical protein QOE76_1932, partial [Frankiales bacterium]|nr:hypothetical protein [Frankiales bacterium]